MYTLWSDYHNQVKITYLSLHILIVNLFFFWWEQLRSSHIRFLEYKSVLPTVVTTLYIRFLELVHPVHYEILYPLINISEFCIAAIPLFTQRQVILLVQLVVSSSGSWFSSNLGWPFVIYTCRESSRLSIAEWLHTSVQVVKAEFDFLWQALHHALIWVSSSLAGGWCFGGEVGWDPFA